MDPIARVRRPFQAVLFDLDGTLVDTLGDIVECTNTVLAAAGFPLFSADAYKTMVGWGLERLMRKALPTSETEAVVLRLVAQLRAEYGRHPVRFARPYTGISELLARVSACGIPIAVVTNKDQEIAANVVARCLPGVHFSAVVGARPGVAHKPDPRASLDLAVAVGAKPPWTAFVGDSVVDMETARNAGFVAFGVGWGFGSVDALLAAGARCVVDAPSALAPLLLGSA